MSDHSKSSQVQLICKTRDIDNTADSIYFPKDVWMYLISNCSRGSRLSIKNHAPNNVFHAYDVSIYYNTNTDKIVYKHANPVSLIRNPTVFMRASRVIIDLDLIEFNNAIIPHLFYILLRAFVLNCVKTYNPSICKEWYNQFGKLPIWESIKTFIIDKVNNDLSIVHEKTRLYMDIFDALCLFKAKMEDVGANKGLCKVRAILDFSDSMVDICRLSYDSKPTIAEINPKIPISTKKNQTKKQSVSKIEGKTQKNGKCSKKQSQNKKEKKKTVDNSNTKTKKRKIPETKRAVERPSKKAKK